MNAQEIADRIGQAVEALRSRGILTGDTVPVVSRTKSEEHGDYTTNFAMVAAKAEKKKPREIAEQLAAEVGSQPDIESAQVAGPGFVNIRVRPEAWVRGLDQPLAAGKSYGRQPSLGGPPLNVEFVSANPTGPLHVGHGRGAVVGDVLVRLLRAAGREVSAEYYWNDRGRQVSELGRSVWIRLCEMQRGELPAVGDENWYRGDYVKDLAREVRNDQRFLGDVPAAVPADTLETLVALGPDDPRFVEHGIGRMKATIVATLARLRVNFEHLTSERAIAVGSEPFFADLETRGLAYREAGALFLRTEGREGEDKDRVVRKSNGEWTYFATDLLYHANKLQRGFGRLINVWGADHHGYIPRMHAGLAALGLPHRALEVLLVQMVNLTAGGQPVRMSKRSGDFVTLDELIDEVGVDATRYVFLTRRHDSQLDFDIELAKKKSLDNPVFYAQYGHARLCAIVRRAGELLEAGKVPEALRPLVAEGLGLSTGPAAIPAEALGLADERKIARTVLSLPDHVAEAAEALEPHRIVYFVQELSQAFQRYYTERWKRHGDPVLPPARLDGPDLARWDWEKTAARLRWIRAIRTAVASALDLAGVEAPERMERSDEVEREDEA